MGGFLSKYEGLFLHVIMKHPVQYDEVQKKLDLFFCKKKEAPNAAEVR